MTNKELYELIMKTSITLALILGAIMAASLIGQGGPTFVPVIP